MSLFDIDAPPVSTRVVVGMSGGVDSAVAAALFVRAGFDVVGVTLELYRTASEGLRSKTCCAGRDAEDAARVARHLGIPHYVLDYQERFHRSVIEPFADAYLRGTTPVPCVLCNQTVKFTDLLETARDLGAAALVTGHYARRVMGPDGPELHRAADLGRDQSYFLFRTTAAQLAFLRFPLGELPKARTRELAREFGLPVAEKPDSQDICFVSSGHYSDVVRYLRPDAHQPGSIVDRNGAEVGRHDGIAHFTVGQRRGLGLGGQEQPRYVIRLEPEARRVVIGSRADLETSRVALRELCVLDNAAAEAVDMPVTVKLRSAQAPVNALFTVGQDGAASIDLLAPVRGGAAPGQAAVIYRGDRVIAGGWIDQGGVDFSETSSATLDSREAITDKARLSRAAG